MTSELNPAIEVERDPLAVLRRVAYLLERTGASPYRVRAFRAAAASLQRAGAGEVEARARAGSLQELPGLGAVTAALVREVLAGEVPAYVRKLEEELAAMPARPASALLDALRGDCHVHSDWSDGVASIREMAEAAIALGHEYIVLTDHSPSLRIANGLDAARLLEQLQVVAARSTTSWRRFASSPASRWTS